VELRDRGIELAGLGEEPPARDERDVARTRGATRGELGRAAATELRDDAPQRRAIVGRAEERIEQRIGEPWIVRRAVHLPVGARARVHSDPENEDEREGTAAHDAP
jgi:hypothetical protein